MTRRRPKKKETGLIDYEAIREHEAREQRRAASMNSGRGQVVVSTTMIPPPSKTVPAPPPGSKRTNHHGFKEKLEAAQNTIAELEAEVLSLRKELARKHDQVESLLLLEQQER